ncbi:hypothetical protein TNCT_322161 [Trichonephila clavata]|uniref:Uncharacterized protein n=1 Tax=Trichonephila clavata TaxID=2740835 RepID=A0A8X6HRT7_TRICU|nr:hypothetical protein TNCT_322161 [Trichonephila clavata]
MEKTAKSLKFMGRLFDYEQVFVDWEKKGIIEKIAQDEPRNDANEGSHLHFDIDPELSKYQKAETSSMQLCSSVSDDEARVEPRAETLELPDDLISYFINFYSRDLEDLVMVDS